MRENRIDLYDANVNGLLHGGGSIMDEPYPGDARSFLLRCFASPTGEGEGILRAWLSDSYGMIDNLDVLMAALDGINRSGVETHCVGADLSETRMSVRFAAPSVQALAPTLLKGYRSPYRPEGQENPVVFAGFELNNSETGGGALVLCPRIIVEICNNGMKMTKDALRKVHLGGKLDGGIIEWSDDSKRKNLELVASMSTDAVATFLDVAYVERKIAELEEKAGAKLADPAKTIELVSKQLNYTQVQQAGILDAFIRGGQVTAGGVLQAVTAYAGSVESPDEAWELENSAVSAMELAAA
jgi:hypothetical protein